MLQLCGLFRDLQLFVEGYILVMDNQKIVNTGFIVGFSLLKTKILTLDNTVFPLPISEKSG